MDTVGPNIPLYSLHYLNIEISFLMSLAPNFRHVNSSTSALLRSSVLRMHPRVKVMAPATVAHQERSHSPWASFTLFWKGNFIFITTMVAARDTETYRGNRGRRATRQRRTMLCFFLWGRRSKRLRGEDDKSKIQFNFNQARQQATESRT